MLLLLLHTTDVITLGPAFTIPQFKAFLVIFFSFPVSESKEDDGNRDFGNQLLLPVLQSPRRTDITWSRGQGWDMCICCTEESKMVPTQQTPKCAHTHTRYALITILTVYISISIDITYAIIHV